MSSVKDYIIVALTVAIIGLNITTVVLKAKVSASKARLEVSVMREAAIGEQLAKSTELLDRQREEMGVQNEAISKMDVLGERADQAQRLVDEYALRLLESEKDAARLRSENDDFLVAVEGKTECETYRLALQSIAGEDL